MKGRINTKALIMFVVGGLVAMFFYLQNVIDIKFYSGLLVFALGIVQLFERG